MPKTPHSLRLSEGAEQALTTYCEKWNLSPTDTIEKMLIRWRYLEDVGFTAKEIKQEEIACLNRVNHNGLLYCMFGVPRNVKLDRRLLETLEICKVCKQHKLGLTEKTLNQPQRPMPPIPVQSTSAQEAIERSSDPNNMNRKSAGQIWCADGGFWVFPKKCDLCKQSTYARWADCKAKPHDLQRT